MNKPKVAIIILNWNRLEDIAECLESVKKTDYPNYEVVIVDNGSKDGSLEKLSKEFPEAIILKNKENMGFAGGNNVGMRYAINSGAKYMWLLNNDTVVEPDTLRGLILEGTKAPGIGLLSPIIYYYSTRSKIQNCGSIMKWDTFEIKDIKNLDDMKMLTDKNTYLYGTALLIKSDVIEKIGYLNESLFAYHEDMEYSLRSLRAGYINRIAANVRVFHKEHSIDKKGLGGLPPHYFYYTTRNIFLFWDKNTKGSKRFPFIKKYIVQALRRAGYCKEIEFLEGSSACLDGVYCAFRNVEGRFTDRKQMPRFIKKLILWHPYFIADILDAKFTNVLKDMLKIKRGKKIIECQKSA